MPPAYDNHMLDDLTSTSLDDSFVRVRVPDEDSARMQHVQQWLYKTQPQYMQPSPAP
jgi:hypothetical protein